MAASPTVLKGLLYTQLSAASTPTAPDELEKFCEALASAIVQFLTTSVQVDVSAVTVATGQGAGGTLTGTGVLL